MPQLERLKLKSPSQKRGRTSSHELAIDKPISMKRGGSTYYYHKDGLGSITEITNSSETVVRSYKYNAFGKIVSETGTLDNPFTYTGRERDEESGLYYYRARYYDPELGRFLNRDPLFLIPDALKSTALFATSNEMTNLYPYVVNNPIKYTDPEGLLFRDCYRCYKGAKKLARAFQEERKEAKKKCKTLKGHAKYLADHKSGYTSQAIWKAAIKKVGHDKFKDTQKNCSTCSISGGFGFPYVPGITG